MGIEIDLVVITGVAIAIAYWLGYYMGHKAGMKVGAWIAMPKPGGARVH
jgi:hypothetical protein